jgi:hypothetical protein
MMGYYKNLLVKDNYPVNTFNNRVVALLQDFVAPFWLFTRSEFSLEYLGMDDELMQTGIRMQSTTSVKVGSRLVKKTEFEFIVGVHGLDRFVIHEQGKSTEVKYVSGR